MTKKFKKIFLHIGQDKTGSTSIQNILDKNRAILLANSVLYAPGRYQPEFVSFFASQPFTVDYNLEFFSQSTEECIDERDQGYIEQLRNEIDRSHSGYLLFSYEGFYNLSVHELQEVKTFLKTYTDMFEIIYYIRLPYSYAASAMSERVKDGNRSWLIHPPITPHKAYIEKFVAVFGKESINIRVFDKSQLIKGDVLHDFFSQIGLPSINIESLESIDDQLNVGLSDEAILIGDKIIQLLEGYITPGIDFRTRLTPTLQKITGRKPLLNPLQLEVIEKATKHDLAYLKREFSISILEQKPTSREAIIPALSPAEADSIARLIIGFLLPEFIISTDNNPPQDLPETVYSRVRGVITSTKPRIGELCIGEVKNLDVSIINYGSQTWYSQVAPVNISYHWFDKKKKLVATEELRTHLPKGGVKHSGTLLEMEVEVKAPLESGQYYLQLTLVQEFFEWFEKIGLTTELVPITVTNGTNMESQ